MIVTKNFYKDLVTYSLNEGISEYKKRKKDIKKSKALINKQLKALIARNLYGVSEFYEMINMDDEAILKAIEVLTDDTFKKNNFDY